MAACVGLRVSPDHVGCITRFVDLAGTTVSWRRFPTSVVLLELGFQCYVQLEAAEKAWQKNQRLVGTLLKVLARLLRANEFVSLFPIFGKDALEQSDVWIMQRGSWTSVSHWAAWQFGQSVRRTLWSKELGMQLRAVGFDTCDMLLILGSAYKILSMCGWQPPMGHRVPSFGRLANMLVVHALVLCAMDVSSIF